MSLRRKALINTFGNSIFLLCLWLLTVISTQLLGYSSAGDLTLAMSLGNIFFSFQMFGVRSFQSSDVSFQINPSVYYYSRLITGAGGLIVGVLVISFLGYTAEKVLTIFLFLLFRTSEAFSDVFYGEFQRAGRLEYAGYSLTLHGVVTVFLFLGGVLIFRSLNVALLGISIGGVLLTILLDYSIYKKVVCSKGKINYKSIATLLKHCFSLLMATTIPILITALPRIALERKLGTETLGYYGNISTPALILTTILPAYISSFFTHYGDLFVERDYIGIFKLWIKTVIGTLIMVLICEVGALTLGKPIMVFVFTEQIIPYYHYIFYLIIAMGLYSLTLCCNAVFVTVRNNRLLSFCIIIALALSLICSKTLVYNHGIGGAIMSLAIPYGLQLIVQVLLIIKILFIER